MCAQVSVCQNVYVINLWKSVLFLWVPRIELQSSALSEVAPLSELFFIGLIEDIFSRNLKQGDKKEAV